MSRSRRRSRSRRKRRRRTRSRRKRRSKSRRKSVAKVAIGLGVPLLGSLGLNVALIRPYLKSSRELKKFQRVRRDQEIYKRLPIEVRYTGPTRQTPTARQLRDEADYKIYKNTGYDKWTAGSRPRGFRARAVRVIDPSFKFTPYVNSYQGPRRLRRLAMALGVAPRGALY